MNAIVSYAFGDQAVRVEDRGGEPWFVLADVCRVLEIRNAADAAARLDPDERNSLALTDTIGREQSTTIINEPGLYRLIFRSRKAAAERFSKWVRTDVLPAIRRTGGYGAPAAALDLLDPAVLHRLLLDHTGNAMAAEARVAELEPQAAAMARLTDARGSLCITDAAKALSVPPRRLFAWMEANSWIYRRGEAGHWVAFQARIDTGLVEHKGMTIERRGAPDRFVEQVLVTPKGLTRLATERAGQ